MQCSGWHWGGEGFQNMGWGGADCNKRVFKYTHIVSLSLLLSPSLSLFLSLTQTDTHMHTHKDTHTHSQCAHTRVHTHAHINTNRCTHTQTHTHTEQMRGVLEALPGCRSAYWEYHSNAHSQRWSAPAWLGILAARLTCSAPQSEGSQPSGSPPLSLLWGRHRNPAVTGRGAPRWCYQRSPKSALPQGDLFTTLSQLRAESATVVTRFLKRRSILKWKRLVHIYEPFLSEQRVGCQGS